MPSFGSVSAALGQIVWDTPQQKCPHHKDGGILEAA